MGGGYGDWEMSLCQAGRPLAPLESTVSNRGGRAHDGGHEWATGEAAGGGGAFALSERFELI